MKLSIIIPVYNEARFIAKVLSEVSKLKLNCEKEIIVVNDGSTDNTRPILERLLSEIEFKLFIHHTNLGKGAAIKTGFKAVTGNMALIQDADLEYDPVEIPHLLAAMDNSVWAVYGKRKSRVVPQRGPHYIIGAKIISWTTSLLYWTRISDVYTGYKLFNLDKIERDTFSNLESGGFEFEAEITCRIFNAGGKIIEVPLDNYIPRGRSDGKHIGLKDAIVGFFTILVYRFRK